eukprot:TRINITY_DN254_c0_g2_i1.p1 TRINITY_DN254_c0_g2~~TRINITY_DN254_c0_g2_i1.p1  ORF type:complete len:506 (+),score=111.42 TRINITY_DN254_c0_g2_i1:48-1520(+)
MALLNANQAFLSGARDPHEQMKEALARRRQRLNTGSLEVDPTDALEVNQEAKEVPEGGPDEFQIYTSQHQGQPEEFPIYTMEQQGGPHEVPIHSLLQQGVPEEFLVYTLLRRQEGPESALMIQQKRLEEFPIYTLHGTAASCDTPADGHLQVHASESHDPPTVTFSLSIKTCHDGNGLHEPAHLLNQQDGPEEFPIYTVHEAETFCDTPVDGDLQVLASHDAQDPSTLADSPDMKACQDGCDVREPEHLLKQQVTPEEFSNRFLHEHEVFGDTPVASCLKVPASDDAQGAPGAAENSGMKTCAVICDLHQPASVKPQDGLMHSQHRRRTERGFKVKLHIYDVSRNPAISSLNNILANKHAPVKLGGIFHAAVEVMGNEWSFGSQFADPQVDTGVKLCAPKKDPNHSYRQTVVLGRTKLSEDQVAAIIADLKEEYDADDYELMTKNCCHFADDLATRLGVGSLPRWLLRLAELGASVESLLPEPVRELLPW